MSDADFLAFLRRFQDANDDVEWREVERALEAMPSSRERDTLLRVSRLMRRRRAKGN